MYKYRNAKYLENGFVDCEIEHPTYGWIPFTLDPSDTSTEVDAAGLFERIVTNGDAAAYSPPATELLKYQAIERAVGLIDAERDRLRYAPIRYGCALFDADADSQANISSRLSRLARGDGLPTPWLGWRDRDNIQHWASDDADAVEALLRGLARSIEDRDAAIRAASWEKKAEVAALETVGAVQSYPVLEGWPENSGEDKGA